MSRVARPNNTTTTQEERHSATCTEIIEIEIEMASLKHWSLEPITLENGDYGGTKVKSSKTSEEYSYTFARSLVGEDGFPHPPFITDSAVKFLQKSCKFRDGDVFVCTYSKCGTTLCEQIVLVSLFYSSFCGFEYIIVFQQRLFSHL